MDYILRQSLTSSDIDFINNSSMEIEIHNHTITDENDSGWCDMATGHRLVTPNDRAIFRNVSEPDLLILKLKYEHHLEGLDEDLKRIYNIDKE